MTNPIPIPRKIDNFRIIRLIGEGGMGRVLLAEDPYQEIHVAIKHIHPNLLRVSNYRLRFEREIEIMTYLSHPNLMPLIERGQVGEIPYYVMPFIDGISVREYLTDYGAFSPEEVLPILEGITSALTYMHSHSMFHRDIKPHNILLTRDRQPILTDFGIAADYNSSTKLTNTIQRAGLGTDGYVAPELRGGAFASPRTDVYSLGMTVYEMLARRSLFEVLSDDVSNPMAPIPEPLHFVLQRAIEQTPRSRYQQVSHFTMDFRSVVEFEKDNLQAEPFDLAPLPTSKTNAPTGTKANTNVPSVLNNAFPDKRQENNVVAILVTIVTIVLIFTVYLAVRNSVPDANTIAPPATEIAAAATEEITESVTEEVVPTETSLPTNTPSPTIQVPADATATFEAAIRNALLATETAAQQTTTAQAEATATSQEMQETRVETDIPTRTRSVSPSPTRTATPAGIPSAGQVRYVAERTSLFDRVGGNEELILEVGTSVTISTDAQGQTYFDMGERRFFAVRAGNTVGWVLAEDLSTTEPSTVPIISNPPDEPTATEIIPPSQLLLTVSAQEADTASLSVGITARTAREVYAVNVPGSDIGVDLVPLDAPVTITEGPRDSNGVSWWRVRTPSGADGWIEASALIAVD